MKIMKKLGKLLVVFAGIALLAKGSLTFYSRTFGPPSTQPTKTPKSFLGRWGGQTMFPDTDGAMISSDVIKERQKDIS